MTRTEWHRPVQINGDLRIRPARTDDVSALATGASTRGLLADRLRRQSEGLGELWVAERDADLVGTIFLWLTDAEEEIVRAKLPDVPLVMNLWVRPDQRCHGIGTDLMDHAEVRLRALGHTRVALGVDSENLTAIRLYKGLAYDRWPYAEDVTTVRLEFPADGLAVRHDEICVMYVKDL